MYCSSLSQSAASTRSVISFDGSFLHSSNIDNNFNLVFKREISIFELDIITLPRWSDAAEIEYNNFNLVVRRIKVRH